ncbi:NTP transferase domain-containing protein, partial [Candidatus Woesearchaeota archaeon]|nr:NTP transferase domain-containing protein [Candidatus Woesearchaeota archaeon]
MKAIIPVAGHGKRLRPLTSTRPKPMVKIAGKPLLGHILDKLIPQGVDEVVFIVGDFSEQIIKYVSEKYKKLKTIYVKQKKRKGNAHAVLGAARHIKNEPVLILFGDTLIDINLNKVKNKKIDMAVWVKEVEDPTKYGVVLTEKNSLPSRVLKIIEKPSEPISSLAATGAYYVRNSEKLFNAIREIIKADIKIRGEYYLTSAIELMLRQGAKIYAFPTNKWLDCGNIPDLLEANREILAEMGTKNKGKVESSVISKPVYIGKESRIINSIIGPYVSIGENVYIENSIIINSIIS